VFSATPGWSGRGAAASAIIGGAILAALASQIRAPEVDGTLIDQVSAATSADDSVQRVGAARGNIEDTILIVEPESITIREAFDRLSRFSTELESVNRSIVMRSPLSAADQTFIFDLSDDDPFSDLLSALHGLPEGGGIVGASETSFAVVVAAPAESSSAVIDLVASFQWEPSFRQPLLFSMHALEQEVVTNLRKDLAIIIPLIGVMLPFGLFLAFSSWRALVLPLAAAASAILVVLSVMSLSDVAVNLVTLLAFPVVLIVTVANSCHFLANAANELNASGSVDASVLTTMQRIVPPFIMSSLTTAFAFGSLMLNDLEPIAVLGRVAAIALLAVLAVTLLVTPLCLRFFLSGTPRTAVRIRAFRLVERGLNRWLRPASIALVFAGCGGLVALPDLRMESDPRAFLPADGPSADALIHLEQNFYTFTPIRAVIEPAEPSVDPVAVLSAAGNLGRELLSRDDTVQVVLEPALEPEGSYLLTVLVSSADRLTEVRDAIASAGSDGLLRVTQSDLRSIYAAIDRQAFGSLMQSLLWSAVVILAAIAVMFRSMRAVIASILVNVIPLAIVCLALWLTGGAINIVAALVFVVALGIIVDDTVHVLYWVKAGKPIAGSNIEFSMLFSTVLLCAGLLICMLSDVETTRRFAGLCATAVATALLADLGLLPALMGRVRQSRVAN
jgi:predicted RND superfamily exporter protein